MFFQTTYIISFVINSVNNLFNVLSVKLQFVFHTL